MLPENILNFDSMLFLKNEMNKTGKTIFFAMQIKTFM